MNHAATLAGLLGISQARAANVLERSGGIAGLRSAARAGSVPGLTSAQAARLAAAFQLAADCLAESRPAIMSPVDVYNHLAPLMAGEEQEHFYVVLFNIKNQILKTHLLYKGSVNQVSLRVGEVFREAVRYNASAIIISHNHPSGDPTPSPEDVAVTRTVAEAGRLMDVELLDHLVIGNGRYVSLKERRLGFE